MPVTMIKRMIDNSVSYGIAGWRGIAGGITTHQDWSLWAQNKIEMSPELPEPQIETAPGRVHRRLDTLGRCVVFVCEQCLPFIETQPAVISVSRHGNLPLQDKLVQCIRDHMDISPTAFTHSVHNRFSSIVSIFSGYRGVNGAYSSTRDGFPLVLSEATALIAENQALQVLIIAYESEIPEPYLSSSYFCPWTPHVVAFVLNKADDTGPKFSLLRHMSSVSEAENSGSCLPLLRAMLNKTSHRDGFWEYRCDG